MERVACFVDGFNLYHSLKDLNQDHLKWLNLWSLLESFSPKPYQQVVSVFYFSAYATWLSDAYKRHRVYVNALQGVGVTPVMGFFKEKDRSCRACGAHWKAHEEKETDVNIGLYMINEAHQNNFDRAMLLSGDSDLAPVIRMLRKEFPQKPIRLIAPPGRRHSKESVAAFGGNPSLRSIKKGKLKKFLLPDQVRDVHGNVVAIRPPEYAPPP